MSSTEKAARVLGQHSGKVLLAFLAVTLLLTVPLLAMDDPEEASSEPRGQAFDLWHDIEERFASPVLSNPYIVESRTGDMLTQAALWELYQNQQELQEADQRGALHPQGLPAEPYLYQAFDPDTGLPFTGVVSIADAVQAVLAGDPRFGTSLEHAMDEQVKLAVHYLLANPATSGLKESFSVQATSQRRLVAGEEIEYWVAPALVFNVLADNQKLGGGIGARSISGDKATLDKEEFSRNVQRVLRGEERTYRLWGVAIDLNLEAEDEGQTAGKFIMFTVVAAVVVVGLSLRSYWATALTGVGLGILMVWLKGISNLVGIKGGLVIELIVPIAMISLGVDFAIHALRRYQDEKKAGYPPPIAWQVGLGGVLGALALAMLSDSIAFLANTSSGIEAVVHFGIAAAIAVASSFIVLGVVLPLVMMRIDQVRGLSQASSPGTPPVTSGGHPAFARLGAIMGGAGASALSGAGVIFLVAVNAGLGVAVLAGTAVLFLVLPALLMQQRHARPAFQWSAPQPQPAAQPEESQDGWLVWAVAQLASSWPVVLLLAAGVTVVAVLAALRLEPSLDVKDFFDSRSDFVVSLDKLDEHIGHRSGEPAVVYIQGDLTDPEALAAIQQFLAGLSDNPYVAKEEDGGANIWEPNLLSVLKGITANQYARTVTSAETGVEINDLDGDGLPDSSSEIYAAYSYAVRQGVPIDENTTLYTADEVRSVLFHDLKDTGNNVAILSIGVPSSREQTTIKAARQALEEDLKTLEQSPAISRLGLTGSLFIREGQLDATTKTLQMSLPIAAAGTLALLLIVGRSLRYGVVTVIPIGLVVAWLYAFMYLAGFALNFVTATIGAISIGVGIDYSIHMTQRFREELTRTSDRMQALRRATRGTGVALLASAASSVVGFVILGFAPMPLFSSFGFLTATMIFLALVASLVVLPSLLLLVTPRR